MNVLLISPPEKSLGFASINSGTQILQGILYVAAAAKRAGHQALVTIADKNNIREEIEKYQPQIVGFTCVTMNYLSVKDTIHTLKNEFPHIYTILGGHHATFMTHEIFAECPVDYICRGEGEVSFPALLDSLENGNPYPTIEGIAYRKDGQVHNADKITLLDNLDDLPRITYDLVAPGLGFSPKIVSSRGCPFNCSFCSISAFYQGKWRQRSVTDVMDDVEIAYREGHRKFWFHDDNLTVRTDWVREFCRELDKRKMKITWNCMSRIDTIVNDPDLIKTMAKAGCVQINIGIESGIQEVLDSYQKKTTLDQIRQAAKTLRKSNIFYLLFMILGSGDQYDTPEYIDQNIRFFESVPFDMLTISILTPLPGTAFYEKITSEGRLISRDWDKYDMLHCVYQPTGVSPQEMESWMPKAYKRIYFKRGLKNISSLMLGFRTGLYKPRRIFNFLRFVLSYATETKSLDESLRPGQKKT
ncbi:MAG TPA: radical SAM protein [Candidatus Cloacimonadota bacterium]|nr:radical SAM protein [Candidatus Cloacimonadota bacterium]